MINIGILYDKNVTMNGTKPFKKDNQYNIDYRHFLLTGKKYGINFLLAPYTQYKNKTFKKAWVLNNKWKKVQNQKLTAVFDKVDGINAYNLKKNISKCMPIINNVALDLLCTDKWLTYKKWPEFFSKTVLGSDISAVKKFKTDLIVIKPRTGASGKDIQFIQKSKFRKISDDYIVQEFISGGKLFHFNGQHDYRLWIVNGKVIYSSVRKPVKHKYLANVGQGGKETYFINKKLPIKIQNLYKKIDQQLKEYWPRIYSLDCMMNKNRIPILLELNSRPGITHNFNKKIVIKQHNAVCAALKACLK